MPAHPQDASCIRKAQVESHSNNVLDMLKLAGCCPSAFVTKHRVQFREKLRMPCMYITDRLQCILSARMATAAGKHVVPLSRGHEEHCLCQGRIFCCHLWRLPGQPCDGAPSSRWEDRRSGAAALPSAYSRRLSTRTRCEHTSWDDRFSRVCVPEIAHSDCTACAVESLWLPHWAAQMPQS